MSLSIAPIKDNFAAEVQGISVSNALSRETIETLQNAIDQHGVLVFRDQNIDDEQQIAFSLNFGEIEPANNKTNITKQEDRRLSNMLADIPR